MEKTDRNILDFSKEGILQVLTKVNGKVEELKNNGEISAAEILEKDVISKYEKLYRGLAEGISFEEIKKDEEKLENIKKYVVEILKDNGITEEYVKEQMRVRKDLQGNSGSEVVKNLFEYEIKELNKVKYNLLDKVNEVLDEEEKISMDLKNAIQEEEQMECIYKLQPVRAKYRELEEKVMDIQNKLDGIQKKLDSKWQYEIYGTVPKENMLKTFNNTLKK